MSATNVFKRNGIIFLSNSPHARCLKTLFTVAEVTAQGALSDGSKSHLLSRLLATTLVSAVISGTFTAKTKVNRENSAHKIDTDRYLPQDKRLNI